jgi:hypothetical protein
MNIVLHQVRTDLLRLRWSLLVWSALLAAATLVPALKLDLLAPDRESAGRVLLAHTWLLNAVTVFGWVLATRVVHADPTDGTTAFWLTRPLPAARLAAAKLALVLGLFVAVPAALGALGAGANGLGGRLLVRMSAEWGLVTLVFVLAIVLLATLTRDVARIVLTLIVSAIAWLSLYVIHVVMATATREVMAGGLLARYSGLLVAASLFCAGLPALIVGQFVSRRTRRSVVLAIALMGSLAALVELWPWNLLAVDRPVTDPGFDARTVAVSVAPSKPLLGLRGKHFYGRFSASGVPPGWVVVPYTTRGRLRLADGTTLFSSRQTWLTTVGYFDVFEALGFGAGVLAAVEHVTGARLLNNPWPADGSSAPSTSIPLVDVPESVLRAQPAGVWDYDGTLTCGALRASEVDAVALRVGGVARLGALEATVVAVERILVPPSGDAVRIALRTARPRLLFPRLTPAVSYVLRNRARGELLVGHRVSIGRMPRFNSEPLDVRYVDLDFEPVRGRPLALDDTWVADAELVLVALEQKGVFAKAVHISDLRLSEARAATEK